MTHRVLRRLTTAGLAAGLAAVVVSQIAAAQHVTPIAEALAQTEVHDYVMVQGVVTDSWDPDRYKIEDDSGEMVLVIPEYMTREQGAVEVDQRIRAWGRIEVKDLDHEQRGMMVSRFYRDGDLDDGATGARNPGASAAAGAGPIDRGAASAPPAATPAAPASGVSTSIEPKASEAFVQEVRAAMRAYRQAEKDAIDAGQVYARAARESGGDAEAEAAALSRLEAAEARVVETRNRIPALVREAREQGVDDEVIEMVEMEAGLR